MTSAAWDALSKILSPILIIAGWYVVVSNQGRQSRRKIIREELETLRIIVSKLGEAAILFHTQSYSDDSRRHILAQLTLINRRLQLLPHMARTNWMTWDAIPAKSLPNPTKRIIALRQAITLNHFDDPAQPALSMTSDEIGLIERACYDLLASLDKIMIAALD